MARKTQIITIPPADGDKSNRDSGKVFLLTEMPASSGERWATRALLALARAGVEIPSDLDNTGMAGMHAMGGIRLTGSLHPEDVEPLMDEMMACIQRVPDPGQPNVTRALIEDDIEEVATRLRLRAEVMQIHLGFSITDVLSNLGASVKRRIETSSNTQTSQEPLAPSSPPAPQA